MKVAVIQMEAGPIKKKNLSRALKFVKEAIHNKSEFIILPEVFNFRGKMSNANEHQTIEEPIPGESIIPFKHIARHNNVYILAGSIYEQIESSNKTFNTSVLINNKGRIQAIYRKIHLFDAVVNKKVIKESRSFLRGDKIVVSSVKEFKTGLSVCYDLRFPELYNMCAAKGAVLLCVPSCFTKQTGEAHWEILLRARAIENLCYLLAPNQIGKDERGIAAYGHSMIIDPWGRILARASANREEIIYADIDLSVVKESRSMLPALKHKIL